jgi:hypothetical protein
MDELDPCQKLIAAARAIPVDDHVPYAFEKRIMACLKGLSPVDPWALWSQALGRSAVYCAVIAGLLGASSFLVPARSAAVPLPQEVAQALLAGVDSSFDQIGDTP